MEETLIWTSILKNQEALLTFLRGQDARHGSSECWPALNLIAPLIIAAAIIKKNVIKMQILHFSRATFTQEEFPISIINAPKRRRNAGNENS